MSRELGNDILKLREKLREVMEEPWNIPYPKLNLPEP